MKDEERTSVTQKLPSSLLPPEGVDERETEKTFSAPAPAVRDRATLTLMSGTEAGQVFTLADEAVIGRELEAQVRLDDGSVSRRHARIYRSDARFFVEDLGSTNGTFVGGHKVERSELSSGDRIQVGPKLTLRFAMIDEAEELLQRQLFESSTRDPLTRAFNRKYLLERLTAEVAHARRHKTSLAVLLFDVDEFKQMNDTHGHLTGDAVLRAIADQVSAHTRLEDVFARFGGEEFVVLIRATGSQDAPRLAERLRMAVERMEVPTSRGNVRVTVSVGVASLHELPKEASVADLLQRADERLYRAKDLGRNRICAAD